MTAGWIPAVLHSWGNTGSFLKLSCYSEALHLLEQSRESSCFLLYEPVVPTEAPKLAVPMPQKHSVPLPRPVHTLLPKGEVVGRSREDCTKQINNVMSPSHRNSILAAPLLQ